MPSGIFNRENMKKYISRLSVSKKYIICNMLWSVEPFISFKGMKFTTYAINVMGTDI